jgi:hypothetical protein
VTLFAQRIKEINPLVNCVVDQRFEKALEEARAVDQLLATTDKTPEDIERETPFLGVPFSCKDSIAVKGIHKILEKKIAAHTCFYSHYPKQNMDRKETRVTNERNCLLDRVSLRWYCTNFHLEK